MITVFNIGHSFDYEVQKLIGIFYPYEKLKVLNNIENVSGQSIECKAESLGGIINISVKADLLDGYSEHNTTVLCEISDKKCEENLCGALFKCLKDITGYSPAWGMLTGIRPAKLFLRLSEQFGEKETERILKEVYFVNESKISLCKESAQREKKIIELSKPESFSLYVSIPFCPTRCSYCSFVSHSVESAAKIIPLYVEKLCEEIKKTAEIINPLGLVLESVYIGGGTPTSLSAVQLDVIIKALKDNFDFSNLREFTVEAGRPDTVDDEKLSVLKKNGVTRISINPQSMNDSVLEKIGRKHTCAQTVEAFKSARKMGFDNINMDLIAGLPGDTAESFKETVKKVIALSPESVTVHSLAFKRASELTKKKMFSGASESEIAGEMVDYARNELTKSGILPYYMYRQSKTVGNLENVGYAKPGFECLYNVFIMDETHSIFAVGASAVSKLREPGGGLIERIFNFKYPYEYINRFEEQILRKEKISEFYDKYYKRNK